MARKILDPNDPFFQSIWVRWLTVLLPLAWAGFEVWFGNPGWAMLFGAAGAYAAWVLLINGPDK